MKKLNELKQERGQLIEEMDAIIKKAETETRDLNADEQAQWNERNAKIEALEKNITMLERQEDLNKRAAAKTIKTPEQKLTEKFDLFRAIREVNKGLDGAEAEVVQEGYAEMKRCGVTPMAQSIVIPSNLISIRKRDVDQKRVYSEVGTSDTTPPIQTGAVDLLSVVRTPIIMDLLGVTPYPGLTGNLKVPKMGQLTATFVSEKSGVDTSGANLVSDTLAPRRVGSGDNFTKELFSQTSVAIQNQILTDFVDAIYRAVQKDLFSAVGAGGTVPSGMAITDTVAVLTHAHLLTLEKTIETMVDGMKWLCTPGQRALLKALVLDSGSGKFAWNDDNTIVGYPAFASNSVVTNSGSTNTAFDVIFGYWRAAVYGQWAGIELIVDPFTAAKSGEYVITANGLFDTGVANALHFAVRRNASA